MSIHVTCAVLSQKAYSCLAVKLYLAACKTFKILGEDTGSYPVTFPVAPCSQAAFESAGLWMDPISSNVNYIKVNFLKNPKMVQSATGRSGSSIAAVAPFTPSFTPLKAQEGALSTFSASVFCQQKEVPSSCVNFMGLLPCHRWWHYSIQPTWTKPAVMS